jgi:hypothetical protein
MVETDAWIALNKNAITYIKSCSMKPLRVRKGLTIAYEVWEKFNAIYENMRVPMGLTIA